MHAYVVMSTVDEARAALALNGRVLHDQTLRVDRAAAATKAPNRTVFVGNLPYTVEDQALYDLFGSCGDVEAVRVVRDPHVLVGKGIAYVMFKSTFSVPRALLMNGSEFEGRPLRVDRVKHDSQLKKKLFKSDLAKQKRARDKKWTPSVSLRQQARQEQTRNKLDVSSKQLVAKGKNRIEVSRALSQLAAQVRSAGGLAKQRRSPLDKVIKPLVKKQPKKKKKKTAAGKNKKFY